MIRKAPSPNYKVSQISLVFDAVWDAMGLYGLYTHRAQDHMNLRRLVTLVPPHQNWTQNNTNNNDINISLHHTYHMPHMVLNIRPMMGGPMSHFRALLPGSWAPFSESHQGPDILTAVSVRNSQSPALVLTALAPSPPSPFLPPPCL